MTSAPLSSLLHFQWEIGWVRGELRLHPCRVARRHCDRRHPGCHSAAGHSGCPGGGTPLQLARTISSRSDWPCRTITSPEAFAAAENRRRAVQRAGRHVRRPASLSRGRRAGSQQYDHSQRRARSNQSSHYRPAACRFICARRWHLNRVVPEPAANEKLGPGSYIISTRTDYDKFGNLDGAFDNPRADGTYSLGMKHITDGTSKTLLVGETNFSHQTMLWSGIPGLNGTPMWGDQTWAQRLLGLESWGHMAANKRVGSYNNSIKFSPAEQHTMFPQRPSRRGAVCALGRFGHVSRPMTRARICVALGHPCRRETIVGTE